MSAALSRQTEARQCTQRTLGVLLLSADSPLDIRPDSLLDSFLEKTLDSRLDSRLVTTCPG